FPLSAILYSYWLSLFSYIAPPPTSIYTLSLHDALPISLVGVGVLEPWVGADELEERLQVALEAHALLQCLHLAAQPLDFVQADVVDLVGREVGGGRGAQPLGVVGHAVGMGRADAGRVLERVRQVGLEPADYLVIGRHDRLQQCRARLFLQLARTVPVDLAGLHQRIRLGL